MGIRVDKVTLVLQLVSPCFTGSDYKTGSETLFRRLKFIVGDRVEEVPYISGNELRGQLRRLIFRDFLKRVGYELQSLKLYHAFFSGGVLEAPEEEAHVQLDVELRRRVRRLIPPASLLGFALGNQVFEGKLKVMHMLPVCRELIDYLPDEVLKLDVVKPFMEKSFYELLDWTFHTRHAEERRVSTEEPAVQMIYRFEVLVPGTVLTTQIICEDCDDVELSCLAHMVDLFKTHGFIGGKSASGYGRFRVIAELRSFNVSPDLYLRYLEEHRGEVVKLLRELEARYRP